MSDPYRNERGSLSSVARSRLPVTALDQTFNTPAKGLEIVNRGSTWATVAVLDGKDRPSTIHAPPGAVIYAPVMVTRVNTAGTTVSGDVLLFALVDA